jgi:glycosyltransferase involved in cell wall biosynthesis
MAGVNVSVVVPNYNHGKFLRQRIETIFAQTCRDFEVILLDDASTDDSREILREYVSGWAGELGTRTPPHIHVRLVVNETNSGSPFKQWNKGVVLAQGKYVWIAESDDYAEPRFLERMVALLESDERVVIAYCRSLRLVAGAVVADRKNVRKVTQGTALEAATGEERVDGFADYNLPDPERWRADFCVEGRELCREYFALITPIPNASSVVFRKDVYDRTGGADESLRLCGDWKVWAAMAMEGKVAYVSEPLNYFRYHGNTARGTAERDGVAAKEFLHVSQWVLGRVDVPEAELDQIRRARAGGWVPAVLSLRTPSEMRREILESVRAFDPHPYRWVLRPALSTVRRKIQRHWRALTLR